MAVSKSRDARAASPARMIDRASGSEGRSPSRRKPSLRTTARLAVFDAVGNATNQHTLATEAGAFYATPLLATLSDGSLKVAIASDVSFDLGSATLRPDAMDAYARIAAILRNYDKTVIHVVGHTDTSGTSDFNQGLSERRAAAVGSFLASQGVPGARLRQEGRGEREKRLLHGPPDSIVWPLVNG